MYKSNIVKYKLNEDPLQRRIYFRTFMESLEVISYQYNETCELLLDYPKIGRGCIKCYVRKAIRNLLHGNIDAHSRTLIAEFPGYGLKCISKLLSNCANITFSEKSRYDRLFQKVTHEGG